MPYPPLGAALTFACPEGQVLSHNWAIPPKIVLRCLDNGDMSPIKEWPSCVSRELLSHYLLQTCTSFESTAFFSAATTTTTPKCTENCTSKYHFISSLFRVVVLNQSSIMVTNKSFQHLHHLPFLHRLWLLW